MFDAPASGISCLGASHGTTPDIRSFRVRSLGITVTSFCGPLRTDDDTNPKGINRFNRKGISVLRGLLVDENPNDKNQKTPRNPTRSL